jgi:hypothetical protein
LVGDAAGSVGDPLGSIVGFVSISATFPSAGYRYGIQRLDTRTALLSLERKPSVRSPLGVSPTGALREVAFARAVKCPVRTILLRSGTAAIAPPALDQGVVEHRSGVVLASDDDDLVPDARMRRPAR